MSWKVAMQTWWGSARVGRGTESGLVTSTGELPVTNAIRVPGGIPASAAHVRRSEKVRSWRRRVLLRRGARLHAAMGADAESCSLAMLDEYGVVVAWYGRADGSQRIADHVVDRHVSQFYVPADIACNQPLRDLHAAIVGGRSTRQGLRYRPDGTTFWGTTVIEAVTLRDGRLQGFSYVTRGAEGPQVDVSIAQRLPQQANDRRDERVGVASLCMSPVRNRMARTRSSARQRVLRLHSRMFIIERVARGAH